MGKRQKRYCETCRALVLVESDKVCPHCGSGTFEVRRIKDPAEVRKLVSVRKEFKDFEEQIIQMIAESGAILEGHFIL